MALLQTAVLRMLTRQLVCRLPVIVQVTNQHHPCDGPESNSGPHTLPLLR